MSISAKDVKKLRDMTGVGMMDCKKALAETNGDFDAARDFLRKKGLAKAAKKAGRAATEGAVLSYIHPNNRVGVLVEINCETDFVAKSEPFQALAQRVLDAAVASGAKDAETLAAVELGDGKTVQALLDEGNASIGERLVLRRVAVVAGSHVVSYEHRTSPDLPTQIGVVLAVDGDDQSTAREVAMHIAALSPRFLSAEEVDEATVENERRIAAETAAAEGKPERALPKIVEGRVKGYFKENVLLDQPFSRDNKRTVGAVLSDAGLTATGFARFRVGA